MKGGKGLKRGADGKVIEQYLPRFINPENPKLCAVCGDKATGYHYGVLTCTPCKEFFRRSIQEYRNVTFKCAAGHEKCEINKLTRALCRKCRLARCFAAGMESKLVNKKNKKIKKNQMSKQQLLLLNEKYMAIQRDIIMETFELAGQTHETSLSLVKNNDSNASRGDQRWQELSTLIVQYIIKHMQFPRNLPFFMQLDIEVQQSMLKSSFLPVMCFRAAYTYRTDEEALVMKNGFLLKQSKLEEYGFKYFMEPIFDCGIKVAACNFDDTEAAYMSVLILFHTFELKYSSVIESIFNEMHEVIRNFLKSNHQEKRYTEMLELMYFIRVFSERYRRRINEFFVLDWQTSIEDDPIYQMFLELFSDGTHLKLREPCPQANWMPFSKYGFFRGAALPLKKGQKNNFSYID